MIASNNLFDKKIQRLKKKYFYNNSKTSINEYCAEELLFRLDYFKKPDDIRILNLNFNNGEIENLFTNYTNIYSCDINDKFLRQYKSEKKIILDDDFLPFAKESFDIIISNLHMHHINDVSKFISDIYEILPKNGIFLASMFGVSTLQNLRYSFIKTEEILNFGHLIHISPFIDMQELSYLCKSNKFCDVILDLDKILIEFDHVIDLLKYIKHQNNGLITYNRNKRYLGRNFFNILNEVEKNRESKISSNFEINFITCIK